MKKVLACIAFILMFACSSPEKDAKVLITERLQLTLHDWSSYESVEYSTLDSTFSSIYDNLQYADAISKYLILEKELDDEESYYFTIKGDSPTARKLRDISDKKSTVILDSMSIYPKIMIDIENSFEPMFNGWKLKHSYRANNAGGNKIIGHYLFYFNKRLTEIINVENISK